MARLVMGWIDAVVTGAATFAIRSRVGSPEKVTVIVEVQVVGSKHCAISVTVTPINIHDHSPGIGVLPTATRRNARRNSQAGAFEVSAVVVAGNCEKLRRIPTDVRDV